ncbi:hypothetical protein Bca52824_014658 [Brassica carinata]|uniref:Hexosyltransferase n=1 Tax=Brassica carinata TaxID=52824 RepID=A0A8X8B3M9_BRACI|nr:hypothetical protein Bca52824_014658 [Brassica carinata]
MASRSRSYTQLLGLLSFIFLLFTTSSTAVRVGVILHKPSAPTLPVFREAPAFRNGDQSFWSDPELVRVLEGKRPCYFNTGVMVVDVGKWRRGMYTQKVEVDDGSEAEEDIPFGIIASVSVDIRRRY